MGWSWDFWAAPSLWAGNACTLRTLWAGRHVTPERREQLPLEINWHSIKNRFLMRIKNISTGLYLRCFLPATYRDLQILGYCLLVNRKLLSSLRYVWQNRAKTLDRRREVQAWRRVSDRELASWFSNHATGEPGRSVRTHLASQFLDQ